MPDVKGLIATMNSRYDCPELAVANEVADRHFDFFFKHYDRAKGTPFLNHTPYSPTVW